jgi:hypothetical protein
VDRDAETELGGEAGKWGGGEANSE